MVLVAQQPSWQWWPDWASERSGSCILQWSNITLA